MQQVETGSGASESPQDAGLLSAWGSLVPEE